MKQILFVEDNEILLQLYGMLLEGEHSQWQTSLAPDGEAALKLLQQNAIQEQIYATQKATVHQAEGTVKADQGVIDSVKLNLTYCKITSPLTGRIGLRLVDPGNIVHASDTNGLLVITQVQPISALFPLA